MFKFMISKIKLIYSILKEAWKFSIKVYRTVSCSPIDNESWVTIRTNKGNVATHCYNDNRKFRASTVLHDGSKWTLTYTPKSDDTI